MKRVIRKVWIGILAVCTVVVGACCAHKNAGASREDLQQQLDQVRQRIREREMSCVYGSPEVLESYAAETQRLRQQADSLQREIDKLDR